MLKKRSFENSIENNNRKAFYQNAKDNFKANLKRVPLYGGIYLATTLILQFLKDEPIDFASEFGGVVVFSFFVLLGAFSPRN